MARNLGIIQSEFNDKNSVVSGEELREELNQLLEMERDEVSGGTTYRFVSYEAKQKFKQTLQKSVLVVYRCTPKDKHMFVAAIKDTNSCCALTGESYNDA